jgi:hypothetical protein
LYGNLLMMLEILVNSFLAHNLPMASSFGVIRLG